MAEITLKEKVKQHCNLNGQGCTAFAEKRYYGRHCAVWSRKVIKLVEDIK